MAPKNRIFRNVLVIVESPTKATKIKALLESLLPDRITVLSSRGHIRDLPERKSQLPRDVSRSIWDEAFGIDIHGRFTPVYVVPHKKRAELERLKQATAAADVIYLATDGDREGEAIAWHLFEVLKPAVPVHRVVFREITKKGIAEGIDNPRGIDQQLVDAQESRRIIDRLIGYGASMVLIRLIVGAWSAGRVQSVAIRLLVERELERMAFRSTEWWDAAGTFSPTARPGTSFAATLVSVGGRPVAGSGDFDPATGAVSRPGLVHLTKSAAQAIVERCDGRPFTVTARTDSPYTKRPEPPFTTQSLQREAERKLGYTLKKTMTLAQRLYENGYITYIRTDSTQLSDEATSVIRLAVSRTYGPEFLPSAPRTFRKKAANAQEAHEAIRPTAEGMEHPETLRAGMDEDAHRLYTLIWKRTMASQMADARGRSVTLTLTAGDTPETAVEMKETGRTIEFPGYRKVYEEASATAAEGQSDDGLLPPLSEGDTLTCHRIEAAGHETQPPARYTEASLVEKLEQLGIGRPSTYATILNTIRRRSYCLKLRKALVPTWTGFAVVRFMTKELSDVVDYEFTRQIEASLDRISRGKATRLAVLEHFYFGPDGDGLKSRLDIAIAAKDRRRASSVPLPCGIVVRIGKYGPYVEQAGRFRSLPPVNTLPPDQLTPTALENLCACNTPLGTCPESGKPVYKKIGRYGPYVQCGENDDTKKTRAKVPRSVDFDQIDLAKALELLAARKTDTGRHS